LTATALASVQPEMQKLLIGEHLFPLILQSQPELAGKITGMLLEMNNLGSLRLLESPDALKSGISDALERLEVSGIQTSQGGAAGAITTTAANIQLCRLLLMGHRILDPGEVYLVKQTASRHDLGGYIKLGYPGYILVEGLADNCTCFVEAIIQQHQTKLPKTMFQRQTAGPRSLSLAKYLQP
jgi:Poly-adenylate binding protein, unique domain